MLCAVSGGADSVALLRLLHENRERLGVEVFAAHFEHGIRGEESMADAAFVQKLCEGLGVGLYLEHGDTPGYAAQQGMGLEEAARELRYAFLERAAAELCCDRVATAHNADDNVETVLFNLARGSGIKGLSGIPAERGIFCRPLLSVTRTEIEDYLREKSQDYVTDSSNASDDYSRNLIRHHVMPVLRQINPKLAETVGRSGVLLRQDEEYLSGLAENFIKDNFRDGGLDCKALLSLHPAVSTRVLRRLCPKSLSQSHVDALMELASGEGLGFADVPGLRVRREQGRLCFDESEALSIAERSLLPGSRVHLHEANLFIKCEKILYNGEVHDLFKTYLIKCESICGQLIIGSRRPGDRISPQGRNCSKSLKSIFVEKKMTQKERALCPVIRDDRGVLVLVGHAVDKRCRPEKGDEAFCIQIEKPE